jgi:hypothetical protein
MEFKLMTTKKRELKEEDSASVAAATLKPNPSRPEMLSTLTQMLAQLGQEDLTHYFNDAMAQIGHEADNIPPNAAAQNAATIATKEDIQQIFGDKQLSEEFTTKASDVFNALVESRVIQARVELEEQFEQKLAEEAESVVSEMTDVLDKYLEYVASEWIKENKLEIESSIKTEIAESLMQGIYNLFVENNLKIPENQVDVVEALVTKVETLETKIEEEARSNLDLRKQIQEKVKSEIFSQVTEGMTATAVEKLKVISESLEFVNEEHFRNKLSVVKESGFDKKTSTTPQRLVEEETMEDETQVESNQPNGPMDRYVQAISKTIVKD